ncbi:MAG: hypothetical protein KA072_13000 [Thermoanaerobaculaceae bacterium]|nr:hypothetical protein [Thermoanaerobaculaceae bacterium]MDI9621500.1 hypothetical protein [Acidobacteriota bacterium]NLH12432.1 hypothetical protein [Holophagae bacterium]HPW55932.1 hypothetical protein [Thermoanaerobaculaceae bacterium]
MIRESLDPVAVVAEADSEDPAELSRLGIAAARRQDFERGYILLKEAYDRYQRIGDSKHLASVLSFYGLCLAMFRSRYREGAQFCQAAIDREFFKAEYYYNLAQVWVANRSRRRAIEAIHRGLSVEPSHAALKELEQTLGRRRRPVIRFLSRDNALNRSLGRLRHRLLGPTK